MKNFIFRKIRNFLKFFIILILITLLVAEIFALSLKGFIPTSVFKTIEGKIIFRSGECWIPEGCKGTDFSFKTNNGETIWLVGNVKLSDTEREVRLFGYESRCTFVTIRPITEPCFRVIKVVNVK